MILATPSTAAPGGFGDVDADAFYAQPVQWMANEAITTGTSTGCFSPDRAVTRGEVATFIWRRAGAPAPAAPAAFSDVAASAFYSDAVAWMAASGITTGTSASTYEPQRPVTRGEVATLLWRSVGRPGGGIERFDDVGANSYYSAAVGWMSAESITTGATPSTFQPNRPVTRGEVATFMWRMAGSPSVAIAEPVPCGGSTPPAPSTTTPSGPPSTTVPGSPARFGTIGVGGELPTGEQCAAMVRPAAETRPDNAIPNQTRGSGPHPDFPRVDGNFTGTTDEILQWAACKWGIDEDIVRAQVVKESWWYQSAGGDLTWTPDHCHPSVRAQSPCPESLGLLQVRYRYHGAAIDDSIASSAYNVDYTYAVMRSCLEGNETWLNTVDRGAQYGPGDLWGCLGVWFSGRWYTDPANGYIADVQEILRDRTWQQAHFLNS
jgi:hypothetical protein